MNDTTYRGDGNIRLQRNALNYSTHALEHLRSFAENVKDAGMPVAYHITMGIAKRLEQSVKFMLPDGGYLFDEREFKQASLDLLHIPYPCIAAEFYWGVNDNPANEFMSEPVPKRIALAWDIEQTGEADLIRSSGIDIGGPVDGTVIWPINYHPGIDRWAPGFCGVLIPKDAMLAPRENIPDLETIARTSGFKFQKNAIPAHWLGLGEIFVQAEETIGSEYKVHLHCESEVGCERMVIIQLCAALNCANVKQETIPAPVALNKKRARKGKPPLFEYKVLAIEADRTPQIRHQHGGSHASPRIHLRRGHIRRLPTKAVWVQPCVVGDKRRGIIVKDYSVAASAGGQS